MKRTVNFIVLLICLSLINCSRDPEMMAIEHYKYKIFLTKDNKFLKLEYYTDESSTYSTLYHYKKDTIEVLQTYQDRPFFKKSIYYLNSSGLADSCADSMFYNSKISQFFTYKFTYDNNGYKIKTDGTYNNVKNNAITGTSKNTVNFDIVKGNSTTSNYLGDCSQFNDFNSLENKLDIVLFLGDFYGKRNTNLISKSYSNCHPGAGTSPPWSNYDYSLNSDGLVAERVETYTYSRHASTEPITKHKKMITKYEYIFQ